MPQNLFQDPAGTIPAILAGQPVGLAVLAKGTVNASQAAALSKPTLARWPRAGVKNLAVGSHAVANAATQYWPELRIDGGVNCVKIGYGVDAQGEEYADYRFHGTATSGGVKAAYNNSYQRPRSDVIGLTYTVKARYTILSGTFNAEEGTRVDIFETVAGTQVASKVSSVNALIGTSVEQTTNLTTTTVGGEIGVNIGFRVAAGKTVDVVVRIAKVELFIGSTPSNQKNYGPNDITEHGVADIWHLYNDGGDSLNVILPAGDYGCAFIDIDRNVTIETVTSDGTTPINTVRVARQRDYAIRAGAFTEIEARAIREKWSREHA